MFSDYTIRVKLPSGVLTEVVIRARAGSIAMEQARAYGQPIGILDSRYI